MTPSRFHNILEKVKSVTKQAADTTAKQAKIARFRMNLITMQTEKGRSLQTIGSRLYAMYAQSRTLEPTALLEQINEELGNIERIDTRMQELDESISKLQLKDAALEVHDITEETKSSPETGDSKSGGSSPSEPL